MRSAHDFSHKIQFDFFVIIFIDSVNLKYLLLKMALINDNIFILQTVLYANNPDLFERSFYLSINWLNQTCYMRTGVDDHRSENLTEFKIL